MVGAVVVKDNRIAGEGFHAEFGGDHAEVVALRAAGEDAKGSDLFVSLEPCNHTGKTPPCVDAIIAAGVRRVVIGADDPNPSAKGGAERLRAAGIEVVTGVEREAAEELNAPFIFGHSGAPRPFISLKLALSLDAHIAPGAGVQQWLTGEASRRYVHKLRAGADAIAVGIGTALADDPQLNVRFGRRPRVAPVRVVFDPSLRLPVKGRLAKSARKIPVWLLGDKTDAPGRAALEKAGVSVRIQDGIAAHLATLKKDGIGHLFVEGGAGIAGALLSAGWVDRLIIFQAPVLLGAGALSAFGTVAAPTGGVSRWSVVERRVLGDDTMTVYVPPRQGR